MWTAAVFAGIALVGIVFLLWFLSHLLQERPLRRRGLDRRQPAEAARYGLRLRSEWAAIKREEQAVTLHSVWQYKVTHAPEIGKGEPSWPISSSSL